MSYSMSELIIKKRDGGRLAADEIAWFVRGYTDGMIPDYQASALLMAIYFRGCDSEETFALTDCMRASGDNIDLSAINGVKVDKHSTGGVGDKVTLIAAPAAAACGVPIAKMSGRGLGFTGGTVDKLESIPGFRTTLDPHDFFDQVNDIGIALIGQSGYIAPADKKLYALRDVTGTVENLSLIASSIMSKKLAAGSDAILLDVKTGSGAFMENEEDAAKLAEIMCSIGKSAGKRIAAVITDMSQPLGREVGNSLEVKEAIETLKGKGPADITELSMHIAGLMICLGKRAEDPEEGMLMAQAAVENGSALAKLRLLIERQGGDGRVTEDTSFLPSAPFSRKIKADSNGFVASVDTRLIGKASQRTGAGRASKEDCIDHAAGITVLTRIGDKVGKGDVIAVLHGSDECRLEDAERELSGAFEITGKQPEAPVLIRRTTGFRP